MVVGIPSEKLEVAYSSHILCRSSSSQHSACLEEREDQLGFVYSILGLRLFKYLKIIFFFFLMVECLEERAQPLEFNGSINYRTTNSVWFQLKLFFNHNSLSDCDEP